MAAARKMSRAKQINRSRLGQFANTRAQTALRARVASSVRQAQFQKQLSTVRGRQIKKQKASQTPYVAARHASQAPLKGVIKGPNAPAGTLSQADLQHINKFASAQMRGMLLRSGTSSGVHRRKSAVTKARFAHSKSYKPRTRSQRLKATGNRSVRTTKAFASSRARKRR